MEMSLRWSPIVFQINFKLIAVQWKRFEIEDKNLGRLDVGPCTVSDLPVSLRFNVAKALVQDFSRMDCSYGRLYGKGSQK